jgi:hypothetical protein
MEQSTVFQIRIHTDPDLEVVHFVLINPDNSWYRIVGNSVPDPDPLLQLDITKSYVCTFLPLASSRFDPFDFTGRKLFFSKIWCFRVVFVNSR